jgi:Zn-dependent M16 (insulinase) family peptidase
MFVIRFSVRDTVLDTIVVDADYEKEHLKERIDQLLDTLHFSYCSSCHIFKDSRECISLLIKKENKESFGGYKCVTCIKDEAISEARSEDAYH